MVKGMHLTLMIGPMIPSAAPREVMDALTDVEVQTGATSQSGFQLKFTLGKRSKLHEYFLVSPTAIIPVMRVVIVVTLNASPHVLIDGVTTNVQMIPGSGGSPASLSVTGKDLTHVMDLTDLTGLIPYPAMPVEARIGLILIKYALFGVIPKIIPSVLIDIPNPLNEIPTHQGTDLEYVQQKAQEVGYVFYHDPGPMPGQSFAYWGPEIKIGLPQPALSIDMDGDTNVESLSFSFDNTQNKLPIIVVQNQETRLTLVLPVPPITPLNPPLGALQPIPVGTNVIREGATHGVARAIVLGLAKAAQTADAVTGNGSLDVLRYGHILKPRGLVGVRGAGEAFDGLYYVDQVTHSIKRGEYKQSFQLRRNGLVSTVPGVPL